MNFSFGIKQKENGQSLMEALIAVGLVIVIATVLISATTTGLKSGQSGKLRSKAVRLSQDGLENSRKLRDSSWDTFQNRDSNLTDSLSTLWYLKSDNSWTQDVTDPDLVIENIYTRSITFMWDSANSRMKVDSVVSWNERNQVKNVTLSTYFTQWR